MGPRPRVKAKERRSLMWIPAARARVRASVARGVTVIGAKRLPKARARARARARAIGTTIGFPRARERERARASPRAKARAADGGSRTMIRTRSEASPRATRARARGASGMMDGTAGTITVTDMTAMDKARRRATVK